MYSIGEYVVYASNGICRVEDIGCMRNSEDGREYYILRPNASAASVLYVPLDNEQLCGKMRYVYTEEQLNSVLAQAHDAEFNWIDDRKTRINVFKEIMHSGDLKSLLLLLRCVSLKKEKLDALGKRLSDADDYALRFSTRVSEEEFAWVFEMTRTEAGEYIKQHLI